MKFPKQIYYCTDNIKNTIWWEKSLAYMFSVIISVISVKYYTVCIRLVYTTKL